ncbi:hypothetical protein C1H46_015957 [Malus baccata]|uniref:Phosphatidate cytidylyltransferase, mitochondrial n=1 Tax=Malus baccata TaxID=106549 RepID=A0A540MHX0_MALBA|nr:hypothetical protein C1H46_015957 [Malus baccata]
MENHDEAQLQSFLKTLPPVEFCCVYGSSLHPSHPSTARSAMVDCILGVSDPQQWHSENLKLNNDHYASWMVLLGGARLITNVADGIGVGVHFNPFVSWDDKVLITHPLGCSSIDCYLSIRTFLPCFKLILF